LRVLAYFELANQIHSSLVNNSSSLLESSKFFQDLFLSCTSFGPSNEEEIKTEFSLQYSNISLLIINYREHTTD